MRLASPFIWRAEVLERLPISRQDAQKTDIVGRTK
jgi:hypothetical protein